MTDSGFESLQKRVMGDMQQVFTPAVVNHAMNPRNVGSIDNADAFAVLSSDCGENMEIWLGIKNERIKEIRFWSDGCGATIACGSLVTELALGKNLTNAWKIDQQILVKLFGGLPEGNMHCAELAVNTLKEAIKDYRNRQKSEKK
jgi:nitrogen fixation NifU-like protein